jgi:trans-aconitate 2-methyltransferase
MDDAWDPQTYSQFMTIRRPALDGLLSLIRPAENMKALDVGCGSGDFTLELHERLNIAETLGLERSEQMLAAANCRAKAGLTFQSGDINDLKLSSAYDLIFCNGVFHYAEDKAALLGQFREHLNPGGQIAIQAPYNPDYFPIALGYELGRKDSYFQYCEKLCSRVRTISPLEGLEMLHKLKFQDPVARLQAHSHPLSSGETLFRWLRTTYLSDFQGCMPSDVFASFLNEYSEKFFAEIPRHKPFHYILQRVYLWAHV